MSQQKHLMLKVKKSVHPNFSAEASHVKSKKKSTHPNVSAEASHVKSK